jgi:hypothetical protein
MEFIYLCFFGPLAERELSPQVSGIVLLNFNEVAPAECYMNGFRAWYDKIIMDANSGGPGGPPGPLGLSIARDSHPLPFEFAWDLVEVTYLWPPG